MESKKGQGIWVFVGIVAILVAGIVIIWVYSNFISGLVLGSQGQQCKLSVTFIQQGESLPRQCKTEVDEVVAGIPIQSDLVACPFNPNNPKNCAVEKISNFAARCWDMLGRGGLSAGDFTCFELCLKPSEGLTTLTDTDFSGVVPNLELLTVGGGRTSFEDVLELRNLDVTDLSFGKYVQVAYDDASRDKIIIREIDRECQ